MNNANNFSVGFIGLGLIGGSIAKNIRRVFPNYKVIGYDVNNKSLTFAKKQNIITHTASDIENSFCDCDYIFLCAPVHYNISYLNILKNTIKNTCILTDVGSVKSDIFSAVIDTGLDDRFIGGHPMVGSDRSGIEAANDRLVENAYYFITPSPSVSSNRLEEFETFIGDLGAIPIIYSPSGHDKVTSYISHIPHIIASSLVNLVKDADNEDGINKQLAAGGFKDITRIASSNPVIWEHILLSNSENIINGLHEYINSINNVIEDISKRDGKAINSFFSSAAEYRNSIPDHATGVIRMTYEVFVDVPDEPGAISKVLAILPNINIKNIGITHNREDEEGVLRLSFYSDSDANKATEILLNSNYQVYER